MDREAVQRWIAGQRAAERRSLELRVQEGPLSSEDSFQAAMELCELAPILDSDPVRDREVAEARRLWTRLKAPWAARRV